MSTDKPADGRSDIEVPVVETPVMGAPEDEPAVASTEALVPVPAVVDPPAAADAAAPAAVSGAPAVDAAAPVGAKAAAAKAAVATSAAGASAVAAGKAGGGGSSTVVPVKPRRNVAQRGNSGPGRVPRQARTVKPALAATSSSRTVETAREQGRPPGGLQDQPAGGDGWRRVGAVVVVLVAAIAVVVLWARPAHEPGPPAAAATTVAPVAVTSLNPTDIAYLQLMISLDTSAGQLFDLIIGSGDPVLGPVARTAVEGHRAELVALRKALTDGGAIEDGSIHAGHDLPGMVVEADMAAIRALPAGQQPAKALEVLREHLTGTTSLCGSEEKNGSDPATKATAAAVLDAHGKLLTQLPAM